MLRSWDPRRNPMLRPDEWQGAWRRTRLKAAVAAVAVAALALGAAAYFWYQPDRTQGMAPEAVVESAGLALLRAGHYRFQMDLSGQSDEYPFPAVTMNGEYQRAPAVMHLAGDVAAGESRVPLEYYLENKDLYMRHPTTQKWLLLKDSPLDEVRAFTPENLAAPFVGGVRHVEQVGRVRLAGGDALEFLLDLDPNVMLPHMPDLHADRVEYRLWVYTRTLEPARFTMQVVRMQPGAGDEPVKPGDRFTYQLSWEFQRLRPLAVPDSIKTSAQDVGGVDPQTNP